MAAQSLRHVDEFDVRRLAIGGADRKAQLVIGAGEPGAEIVQPGQSGGGAEPREESGGERETAAAENVRGGYPAVYPALKTMEENGWVRRSRAWPAGVAMRVWRRSGGTRARTLWAIELMRLPEIILPENCCLPVPFGLRAIHSCQS